MKKVFLQKTLLFLSLLFIGVACDNSSGSEDGDSVTIEGRVENINSSDTTDTTQSRFKTVEGAAISAARIQMNGDLRTVNTVGDSAVVSDAEGAFTLELSTGDLSADDQLLVLAESEGETAMAFVTSALESGSTVIIQPITFESTAEAAVNRQVVADGNTETVHKADIEVFVNTETAVDIESDSALAAQMATALNGRAATRGELYNALDVNYNQERRDEIRQIKLEAQTELENRLYASITGSPVGAFDDFVETLARADMEAGINATAAAKATKPSSLVLINNSTEFSEDAQAEIRQQAAFMFTFPLDEGVRNQLQFAGASDEALNTAEDAATALRADLQELNTPSQVEIEEIFDTYRDRIVDLVRNDLDVNGQLFTAANAAVNQNGGAKSSLEAALDGIIAVPSVVDAYTRFFSDVQSISESTFDDASDAEQRAYFTQLLILINLHT